MWKINIKLEKAKAQRQHGISTKISRKAKGTPTTTQEHMTWQP